jgi:hypothetical protein
MDDLDEVNHRSSHTPCSKTRRRSTIDVEFHEHDEPKDASGTTGSYETAPLTDDGEAREDHWDNSSSSTPNSDEDSFCAASDDCEPDKDYMESILLDYHPDRLNLLELAPPEVNPPETTQSVDLSAAAAAVQAEVSGEENGTSAATTSTDIDSNDPSVREETENNEESESGEREDSFPSPTTRSRPRHHPGLLQSMGKSTKKSFRKMQGSFFSKSFKGLARSFRGENSSKGLGSS